MNQETLIKETQQLQCKWGSQSKDIRQENLNLIIESQ